MVIATLVIVVNMPSISSSCLKTPRKLYQIFRKYFRYLVKSVGKGGISYTMYMTDDINDGSK